MAFCCHNPFIHDDVTPKSRMPFEKYKTFLNAFKIDKKFAKENLPGFELLLSMEVDYHIEDPSKTEEFVKLTNDFDALLGSIHYYEI